MNLVIGCDSLLIGQSQAIRHEVFVLEQDISPELDGDDKDSISQHAIVYLDCKPVGCARLTISQDRAVLSRVAILHAYRGVKLADVLIKSLLSYAQRQQVRYIPVHAHHYLKNYYQKLGFEFIRESEIVGHHQLIELGLSIQISDKLAAA